ncbi:hypothetical protein [Streptomyces sp. KL2]|uniref:hypothetical protein n=1 Tax=Streptomyces sp. KL2 TaxID=3050126 RepID=UPI003978F6BC
MNAFSAKKITILTTVLVMAVLAGGVTIATLARQPHAPAVPEGRETRVDLERRVTSFTAAFGPHGGYRPPARDERRAVADGVGLLLDGRREEAVRRLSSVGYGLLTLTDRVTGRRFAEVAEAGGGTGRGWGRVYLDLDSPPRWSVQVPHPVADRDTERFGVAVLRGTPGGVLVLAGAHRRAGRGNEADVAHRSDTVFHVVCGELVERGMPAVQAHGFADDSAPGYDAIVSTGRGEDGRDEARELTRVLRDGGFEVCRAWARRCPLEGRTNRQGRRAAVEEVPFLHLELSRSVRDDEELRTRTAEAVAATAAGWR